MTVAVVLALLRVCCSHELVAVVVVDAADVVLDICVSSAFVAVVAAVVAYFPLVILKSVW